MEGHNYFEYPNSCQLRGLKRVSLIRIELVIGNGENQNPFRTLYVYFDDKGNAVAFDDISCPKYTGKGVNGYGVITIDTIEKELKYAIKFTARANKKSDKDYKKVVLSLNIHVDRLIEQLRLAYF